MAEPPVRILRARAVAELTGLARPTIYAYMKRGDFPQSVRLGPGTVGWRQSDVDAWIEERPRTATA